jgi:hypothetical protein
MTANTTGTLQKSGSQRGSGDAGDAGEGDGSPEPFTKLLRW